MANYRYKIYNKRGKLVAEATTKREAEKEAKKLGGHYMDQSGLYQLKNPHCVSNPGHDGWTTIYEKGSKSARVKHDRGITKIEYEDADYIYPGIVYDEFNANWGWDRVPPKTALNAIAPALKRWARANTELLQNPHCVSNPKEGEYVRIIGGVATGAEGELLEPVVTTTGARGFAVRLTKDAYRGKLYGQAGDEIVVQERFIEAIKRPNPHCYKNPADDPDFQRGFSAGLAAIAAATSYYGKRANPEPEAPSQASPAYQAGFVAAVQMFGVHLISQSDISRAVVEQLAGATLAAPTTPRPTPRKRREKPTTLSQEPEVSALATMVLNVIPPEANSPATKVKRGMIIGAVGAIDAKAAEQLKKGVVWSATIKELIAAGLVAQDGTKRGAGYYLTGKQAMVVEEEPKVKKPRKKRTPKKAEEKPEAPAAALNDRALAEAQAAALAAGIPQDEVDNIVTKAKGMYAKGEHPVVGLVTVGGNTLVSVFPLGDKTVEGIKNDLRATDPKARVFDLLVQSNPYFGRGKARFFGAWG